MPLSAMRTNDSINRLVYYWGARTFLLFMPITFTKEELNELFKKDSSSSSVEEELNRAQVVYSFLVIVGVVTGLALTLLLTLAQLSLNINFNSLFWSGILSIPTGLLLFAIYLMFRSYPVFLASRKKVTSYRTYYAYLNFEYLFILPIFIALAFYSLILWLS